MNQIYLLVHKTTYGSERKVLRAFQHEVDAQDVVKVMEGLVNGSLEVLAVDFVGGVKIPDGWRTTGPAPSFTLPGVFSEIGRAELP